MTTNPPARIVLSCMPESRLLSLTHFSLFYLSWVIWPVRIYRFLKQIGSASESRLGRVEYPAPSRASANPSPFPFGGCLDTPAGSPEYSVGLLCRDAFGELRFPERTVAEERTRSMAATPCHRGRLRGIESGGIPGSYHGEGQAREAIYSSADLASDAARARYRYPVPDSP
jgi:hypothetical protein